MAVESLEAIKAKEKFVVQYDGTKFITQAVKDGDDLLFQVLEPAKWKGPKDSGQKRLIGGDDGKTFRSLNALMMAIVYPGKSAPAATQFWTPEKAWTPDMAREKREARNGSKPAAKAKAAPKAEAPKVKATRKGGKNGPVTTRKATATEKKVGLQPKVAAKASPKSGKAAKSPKAAAAKNSAPVARTRGRPKAAEPEELDI